MPLRTILLPDLRMLVSHFKTRAEGGFGWFLEKAFLSESWWEKALLESILRLILGQTESSRVVSCVIKSVQSVNGVRYIEILDLLYGN